MTCETNGNYRYDGSGVLNAGSGGSVYRIEYEKQFRLQMQKKGIQLPEKLQFFQAKFRFQRKCQKHLQRK